MRFPSLAVLAERGAFVLRRFPWTMLVASIAAVAAIVASGDGSHDFAGRLALVATLGIAPTVGLTLLAEVRNWSAAARIIAPAAVFALLAIFLAAWPGVEIKHELIRYLQLSAVLHLSVAFLPFLGAPESIAFWQYNRRLFLGFLRAVVFSGVLYVGLAIALAALDHLFGAHVPGQTYARMWLVVGLVVNTWIFLAAVPEDLPSLADDLEYPRALKVFTQYILTPLAFGYLIILLAYLVKLVSGADWPSGWIGWLVASVAVTGLLGFLLVHPLRASAQDGWIRTYARWLFVGLIPASVMLLVAFWKRILPYGLTEPRVLGLVLGLWLLAVALAYTLRPLTSIRVIPVSLAALLLLTLYGPLSLTQLSVNSQGSRMRAMLAANSREADAALRFLLDHRAGAQIARAIGKPLPHFDWNSVGRSGERRDSVARTIMALAGRPYLPEYFDNGRRFHLSSDESRSLDVGGYDWAVRIASNDSIVRLAGSDSVRVTYDTATGIARVRAGGDTIVFDLTTLGAVTDSIRNRGTLPDALAHMTARPGGRAARLELLHVTGTRAADTTRVHDWSGWLLLAARGRVAQAAR